MVTNRSKWSNILDIDKRNCHFKAQLDVTFFIDKMFREGEFLLIDVLMDECKVEELSTELLISILSSSSHAKEHLHYRNNFVNRVKSKFHSMYDEKYVYDLMLGLE